MKRNLNPLYYYYFSFAFTVIAAVNFYPDHYSPMYIRFQILLTAHSLEGEGLRGRERQKGERMRGRNERDNVGNNYSRGKFTDYEEGTGDGAR